MVRTPEAAPAATTTPEEDGAPGSRRGFLVPALIAALVVVLAVAGTFAFLWLQSVDTSPREVGDYLADQGPEVADTATEVATLLTNYDSTNIERRRSEIVALSVGRFREQYEDLLSQGLGAALEETSASSRGQILQGPDISFVSGSEAKAILRTSQTVQSNENPGGRTFEYVMQLTLIDMPDGGWKVNGIEILSTRET